MGCLAYLALSLLQVVLLVPTIWVLERLFPRGPDTGSETLLFFLAIPVVQAALLWAMVMIAQGATFALRRIRP